MSENYNPPSKIVGTVYYDGFTSSVSIMDFELRSEKKAKGMAHRNPVDRNSSLGILLSALRACSEYDGENEVYLAVKLLCTVTGLPFPTYTQATKLKDLLKEKMHEFMHLPKQTKPEIGGQVILKAAPESKNRIYKFATLNWATIRDIDRHPHTTYYYIEIPKHRFWVSESEILKYKKEN